MISKGYYIYVHSRTVLGAVAGERELLAAAFERFPGFDKLHLMRGQLEERAGDLAAARAAYQTGSPEPLLDIP